LKAADLPYGIENHWLSGGNTRRTNRPSIFHHEAASGEKLQLNRFEKMFRPGKK